MLRRECWYRWEEVIRSLTDHGVVVLTSMQGTIFHELLNLSLLAHYSLVDVNAKILCGGQHNQSSEKSFPPYARNMRREEIIDAEAAVKLGLASEMVYHGIMI